MRAPESSHDPVAIAQRLIACRSVTPQDGGALDYLAGMLREAGFAVEIVTFSGPGAPETPNLFARLGEAAPNLAFAGHTDVVPPGDAAQWRFDPFSGELADGYLWGRGAADMKGGVAASVAAALRFAARGPFNGSISFLITGDEEGPAVNGTVKLLEWARARGHVFDHCILGEPTSRKTLGDTMKNGRRGSLTGRLTLIGKQGHAAYPQLADNPLRRLGAVCAALYAPLDAGTADFEPSNLEIVSVDVGNPATNVIPGEARLAFNIRFNDAWTPETLSAEIARRVGEAAGDGRHALRFEPTNAVAFLTRRGAFTDLLSDAVESVVAIRPALATNGGTSDARFIKDYCEVVDLGLVGATMHATDERVLARDIEDLARIYERALELYFKA